MQGSVSLAESLASLNEPERSLALADLSDEEALALLYDWRTWARPKQLEPAGDWHIWLVLAGRGFGKTRLGAEWVREQVKTRERVNLIGKDAADLRSVMIEGESGILAVCPDWERPTPLWSQRRLKWPNGAITEWRSGEDPEGVRGLQHEALWCDELAAWQYVDDTWHQAMLGLRAISADGPPKALVTTTPKPIPLLRDLVAREYVQITSGSSYENRPNLSPVFFAQVIVPYEGTRLGRQEINAELLLDEGLAYSVVTGVHVVPELELDPRWARFECMDYGSGANSATAWYTLAVDFEGNLIVVDEFYEPGLPSETATKILAKRRASWGEGNVCWADPSVFNNGVVSNKWGRPAVVADEFRDAGIHLSAGNHDRRAGFIRISELLKLDQQRVFPFWHDYADQPGSPGVFIVDRCENLVQQLRDAPLEDPESPLSKLPGEAVEREWEGRKGHAHAAFRYGVMSRPRTPVEVKRPDFLAPALSREELMVLAAQKVERKRNPPPGRKRYRLT